MISKLFAKAYSVTQWRKSNYNKGIMADLYAIPSGEYLVSSTRYKVLCVYYLFAYNFRNFTLQVHQVLFLFRQPLNSRIQRWPFEVFTDNYASFVN